MKKLLLTLLFLSLMLITPALFAQEITWTEKTETVDLPNGVRFYEGIRSSPAFKGWYFEVDMVNTNIALVPYLAEDGTESISNFAARKNVYAAINGGYFGGGISYSSLIQPGQVLAQNVTTLTRNSKSYPIIRSMFGIKKDRTMAVDWIYHFGGGIDNLYRFDLPMDYGSDDDPLPAPVKESGEQYSDAYLGVGGGPVLVKGDTSMVTYDEEIFWGSGVGLSNSDPRTAVGYTSEGKAILMVVDGRQGSVSAGVSLTELADIMIGLGATEAINLDGGGSSQMVIGDSLVNRPSGSTLQRRVATFLAIVPSDSIPSIPAVGYEQILDTGDESSVDVSEGWIVSANAGFYGDTPSLITLGGDGSEKVTFNPDLPESNLYELYGWWVSSSNRSKKAAYIVFHEEGTDTVYADQSTDNSQWVKLGEFRFSGTNSDSVVISNTGGDVNNYVVADAIRFVGIEEQITSTENTDKISQFVLNPAYPNPFNPTTNITYQVPSSGNVKVEVFNINGQLIQTLFDGKQSVGSYQFTWNAENLSSGVYFVKIDFQTPSNTFSQTQKVTLIK